jgi:hypothetical protein
MRIGNTIKVEMPGQDLSEQEKIVRDMAQGKKYRYGWFIDFRSPIRIGKRWNIFEK